MKRQRTKLVHHSNLDLPDDCWELVLKFMNDGNEEDNNRRYYLNSLSLVSKRFLSITNRHKLCLRICHPTVPFLRRLFLRFTNLTSLDLSYFHGDLNNLLIEISTFPLNQLTSLNLSNQPFLPETGLRALSSSFSSTLTSLTCTKLYSINITHAFKLISDCFPLLQQLDLNNPGTIILTDAVICFELFKLRKVNLSRHHYINDEFILNLFKYHKFIEEAIFSGCSGITHHGIASALPHISPNLRSLFLPSLPSSNDYAMLVNSTNFLHSLTSNKALTCLDLSCWCISDHFLSSIAMESLPLTRLGLGCCTGYTYSGILAFVSKCFSIQHLDLGSANFLTNHLVSELSSFLPRLVSIDLSYCNITDSAFFALIRNCPSLTEIIMTSTCIGEENTTAHNSMDSVVYPQLQSLCLSHNYSLKDENIIMFASLFPNLQLLDLTRCYYITEQGIAQVLRRCRKIRHLDLSSCSRLRSLGMKNFEVPNLEVLNLMQIKLDDQELDAISKSCPGLLQLSLQFCKDITNKGVMNVVRNCTKLREIILDDCLKVHASVVASMVLSSPSLRKIAPPPNFPFSDRNRKFFLRYGCLLEY